MQWAKKQSGFTIVELLIVIVVIAILAAITIVSYNGITNRANDTAVKSDLTALMKRSATYAVEQGSSVQFANINQLSSLGFKASKGAYAVGSQSGINLSYCTNATASLAGVIAKSKSGKVFYHFNGSIQEHTGSWNDVGAAPNCAVLDASLTSTYTGYVSTDTTTGPWRAWAGGN